MAELLRSMVLRGDDLESNLEFHRGLTHWLLGENPEALPSTAFVACYLAHVARLRAEALKVDLTRLWKLLCARILEQSSEPEDMEQVLTAKSTLLKHPINALLSRPHLLSGWLSHYRGCYKLDGGKYQLSGNPWHVLAMLYRYLGWTDREHKNGEGIWHTDARLLEKGDEFYRMAAEELGTKDEDALMKALSSTKAPAGTSAKLWREIREAHLGFQCANEILLVPAILAGASDFYALGVDEQLNERIPAILRKPETQTQARSTLAPPPKHHPDEIVAPSGGMFYRRELPELPPIVSEGQEFKAGDPLCVIEVMKMFNKLNAPFAGTIEQILAPKDGAIIKKGQPLFKVRPKDKQTLEDPVQVAQIRSSYTDKIFNEIAP
jgi:biotin carboxyl carrier protein